MPGTQGLKDGLAKSQQIQSFPTMIQLYEQEVAKALPAHLKENVGRYTRLALTQYKQTPKLAECDPRSIFAGVILASQLGLELGVMGHGWLVPYGGQAQFIPGWRGIVDLVHRSGRAMVWTGCVFEGDVFDFQLGDNPYVRHRPSGLNDDDDSKIIAAYSIGKIKGMDYSIVECWPITKIKRHLERYNKVGKRHYAYENMEMYARKVVLLQTIKYLPASVELNTMSQAEYAYTSGTPQELSIDTAAEGLIFPGVIDATPNRLPETAATTTATTNAPKTTPTTQATKPAATTKPAETKAAEVKPTPVETKAAPAPEPVQAPLPTEEPAAPAATASLPEAEEPTAAASDGEEPPNEPGETIRRVQFPKRYHRIDGDLPVPEELKQQARDEAKLLNHEVDEIAKHWLNDYGLEDLNKATVVCLIEALKNVPRK